ncbi:MAG TPA: EamA family transporter [Candidatus Saccharimonadales bacterium]|nr:EamA family transporter [Candidatus Saccharimonadales bacterium]HSX27485.1 EamA family transporter [Patescibacteria group bacterium]
MSWLLLTFLSVISRSIYGVLTKILSNQVKTSVFTQAALLSFAGGLISLLISPLLGGLSADFSKVSLTVVAFVILGQGLGNITYFQAIKKLTNGTAQIAFSSILVFNTFLSLIFLNLHLTPVNVFGVILLMLAILSVTNGKVEFNREGVLMMIFAAFLFSVFQLSSAKLSKQVGATTYLLIAYFGAALVVFALKTKVIVKDLALPDRRSTLGLPLITAVPSLGNFAFAYYAYRDAPQPAKVAMLLTSQVVLTVFLSYVFLKEKGHFWPKVIAAALVVIAAVLIKRG